MRGRDPREEGEEGLGAARVYVVGEKNPFVLIRLRAEAGEGCPSPTRHRPLPLWGQVHS